MIVRTSLWWLWEKSRPVVLVQAARTQGPAASRAGVVLPKELPCWQDVAVVRAGLGDVSQLLCQEM